MNKEVRHEKIIDLVKQKGKISVTQLSSVLDVTPETIRRDLDELENQRMLTRIHGAAIPYSPNEIEMIFEKKMNLNIEAKRLIAQKAASFINDGDTIAVDVGTTTVHIADMLNQVNNLTVITNSLVAALAFNNAIEDGRMTGQVIMLPGVTNPSQASVKGSYTVNFLNKFHVDKSFISCGGILDYSVFDYDMEESSVSTTMIKCCEQSILLVDKSKIDVRTLFEISSVNDLTMVISDCPKPANWENVKGQWIEA